MSSPLPITFHPLLMERPWGGRRLETELHITLPDSKTIGELWALVDRPEAQSIVNNGPFQERSLHELWSQERFTIFGSKHLNNTSPRFPLLCKILDAAETLSLQVHPSATSAVIFNGELKTEFWYFLKTEPDACCYAGFKKGVTREAFETALKMGTLEEILHRIITQEGDSLFIPSGRLHALGRGNLVIEIQENSDTTYRVFDWNRRDQEGRARSLHLEEAMASIDFEDEEPSLEAQPSLITSHCFHSEKWNLSTARSISTFNDFAVFTCLTGQLTCGDQTFHPGAFFLLPSSSKESILTPQIPGTTLLCTRLPYYSVLNR
ncbi:MAG: type I phosphomannose isomerase catalytic subunit [Chthoniobacterales bacterium]